MQCCYLSNQLVGYAVITKGNISYFGLSRTKISDLCVEGDDPQLIGRLLHCVYDYAKSDDSYDLEVIGFPDNIRESFQKANPHSRQLQSSPYFYIASDTGFHNDLLDEQEWFACPFDGDISLFQLLVS